MKTINVRGGNKIIISGEDIMPIINNGDHLSLGEGAKVALIQALIDTLQDDNSIKSINNYTNMNFK